MNILKKWLRSLKDKQEQLHELSKDWKSTFRDDIWAAWRLAIIHTENLGAKINRCRSKRKLLK